MSKQKSQIAPSRHRFSLFGKLCKAWRYLKKYGLHAFKSKLKDRMRARKANVRHRYTEAMLAAQKTAVFEKDVTFSILVPLYNTPSVFLNEMIDSVIAQTYGKWQLCLADGSDGAHSEVGEICATRAQADDRICYQKLSQNGGISENTNACLAMATGEFIVLFDHDDLLHPAALYEIMCAICNEGADLIYTDEATFEGKKPSKFVSVHHKPEYSPDTLRSYNYICHLTSFSRDLLDKVGGFRKEFDGSQDYDMILRLCEAASKIVRVPRVLYFWRSHAASVAFDISAKPHTLAAARAALTAHLQRIGLSGEVTDSLAPSTYRIRYEIKDTPLISIIIPNMDHIDVLSRCIESVEALSTYPHFEILLVENNSKNEETFLYYNTVCEKYANVRLIRYEGPFNFSAINNFAAKEATGKYLLLLNNDIEIITPAWLEEMLMFAQRDDVGAVGPLLYYPDNTVQHAGVILGIGGVAGHSHKYYYRGAFGYMSRLSVAQNLSAVTAACMMVDAEIFRQVGGFDETLAVAFNDVDLCMKIRQANKLIVFTPYAEAYHHESKSRGLEDTPEKIERFHRERDLFLKKWGAKLQEGDPYYNPNLSLTREDFSLR